MMHIKKCWRLLSCSFSLLLSTSVFAADKPNILVIWGDDIGWQNVSAYGLGTMGYTTPNIDKIANEAYGAAKKATTTPKEFGTYCK